MKSVKKTITAANLDTGNEQQIVAEIINNQNNREHPQEMLVINNTGATIGLLYIQSDEENTERQANDQFHDFIPLDTGRSSGILPAQLKYIYAKKLDGTASTDLDLYLTSYLVDY